MTKRKTKDLRPGDVIVWRDDAWDDDYERWGREHVTMVIARWPRQLYEGGPVSWWLTLLPVDAGLQLKWPAGHEHEWVLLS